MKTRMLPVALSLFACLALASTQSQAFSLKWIKGKASQDTSAEVAVTDPAPEQSPHQDLPASPALPDARYPNGLGWRAVENDFSDVKAQISEVSGKVDAVKADTAQILTELDQVDADHAIIKNDLADIKADLGEVKSDVGDIKADIADIKAGLGDVSNELAALAGDVALLKNTLQIQLSVNTTGANGANSQSIMLYVQVSRNGVGVPGLQAGAFIFANSFPNDSAPSYCGAPDCFTEGAGGLYALRLDTNVNWQAGSHAGFLTAEFLETTPEGDVTSYGTSLASFEIPAFVTTP